MAGTRFLDDLARNLAEPMPRGRAVRLAVGAVLGVAVPAVTARPALAGRARTSTCGPDSAPGSVNCDCPAADGLFMKSCCGPGEKCVCFPDRAECHRITCPPGREWCGAVPCCKPGESCSYDGSAYHCTCEGQRCGSRCCRPNETCAKGACCPNSRVCGTTCCPRGTKCTFSKGKRFCCPSDRVVQTVTSTGKLVKFCCPSGTVEVSGPTVFKGQACCSPQARQKCCRMTTDPLDPDTIAPLFKTRSFCVNDKTVQL
jgi:hypothetical protein